MSFKHFTRKSLSLILVLAMVLTSIFGTFNLTAFAASESAESTCNQDPVENMKGVELIDQRKANSKTYQLENGLVQVVLFGEDVHYLENGEYKDIDNSLTLVADKDGVQKYVNTANSFAAEISANSDKASITQGKYKLEWQINNISNSKSATYGQGFSKEKWSVLSENAKRSKLPNLSSGLTYKEVLENIDLQYTVTPSGIKENIILNQKSNFNSYTQTITVQNLELVKNEDGSINALDSETKEIVFVIQAPLMEDSDGGLTRDIKVELIQKGDTYTLTYYLDEQWLETAVYPVIVDPSITLPPITVNVDDTRICERYSTTNYAGSYIMCTGYGSSSYTNYSLVRFNSITTEYDYTKLVLAEYKDEMCYDKSTSTSTIEVKRITSSWNASTVTWATQHPSVSNDDVSTQTVGPTMGVPYTWDITGIAKKWYTLGNNGLRMNDTSTTDKYKTWRTWQSTYGNTKPTLVLSYDTTAPTTPSISTSPVATSTWTNDNTLTLNWSGITDSGGSELKNAQYKIDSGSWIDISTSYGIASGSCPITLSSSGAHTIYVRGVDNAYNYGTASSVAYKLDITVPPPPTNISANPSGWTNGSSITLSFTDPTDSNSGINRIEYQVDSNSWITLSNKVFSIASYSDGTHTVKLRSVDNAGNISTTISTVYFYKDVTNPVPPTNITVTPSGWTNDDSIVLSYTEPTDASSGINRTEYMIDDSGQWETMPGNKTISISSYEDGAHSILLRAVDNAGNDSESSYLVYFYKDVSGPNDPAVVDAFIGPGSSYNKSKPTVVWSGIEDSINEVQKVQIGFAVKDTPLYEVTFNDVPVQYGTIQSDTNNPYIIDMTSYSDGDYDIWVRGVDSVGNFGTAKNVVFTKNVLQLTAVSNLNYCTFLKWSGDYTQTYNIYRKTTGDYQLVATIADNSWYDSELVYGQTAYYKIETTGITPIQSIEVSATAPLQSELEKMVGEKPYYVTEEFSTGSGIGEINLVSGNLYYQTTDVQEHFAGIKFVRTYNSQVTTNTALGQSWDYTYNDKLIKEMTNDIETAVILKTGDGTLYKFLKQGDDYITPTGCYLTLTKENGIYKITTKNKSVWTFNDNLQLSTVEDRNGNTITFYYYCGRLEFFEDDNGNYLYFEYRDFYATNNYRMYWIEDCTFGYSSYYRDLYFSYSEDNNIVGGYIDSNNVTPDIESYSYEDGKITGITNYNGKETTIDYTQDKVTSVINAIDEVLSITYGVNTTTTSFRGADTVYNYNGSNLVISVQNALGVTTTLTYDANYNLVSSSYVNKVYTNGQLSNVNVINTYSYDSEGNLLQQTRPDGYSTYYLYETGNGKEFGQPASIIKPYMLDNGTVYYSRQDFTYDTNGNLLTASTIAKGTYEEVSGVMVFTQVGQSVGSETEYQYDSKGNLIYQTVTVGTVSTVTKYDYDSYNRLIKTTNNYEENMPLNENGKNLTTEQGYDVYGNIEWQEDSEYNVTWYDYDILGRCVTTYYADDTYTSTEYDQNGNIVASTDAEDSVTKYEYDDIDRCIKTIYPDDTPQG